MSSNPKPEPINLDSATTVILAIAGKFDNIFISSGAYDIAGIAVRWIETRGNTHYFSPIDRPHPFQLSGTPFDKPDEPDDPLIIAGEEFIPMFSDTSQELLNHVPADWDVVQEPLYYYRSGRHVVLFNDDTSELRWNNNIYSVEFEDGEGFIFSVDEQYDSIAEMIEALS